MSEAVRGYLEDLERYFQQLRVLDVPTEVGQPARAQSALDWAELLRDTDGPVVLEFDENNQPVPVKLSDITKPASARRKVEALPPDAQKRLAEFVEQQGRNLESLVAETEGETEEPSGDGQIPPETTGAPKEKAEKPKEESGLLQELETHRRKLTEIIEYLRQQKDVPPPSLSADFFEEGFEEKSALERAGDEMVERFLDDAEEAPPSHMMHPYLLPGQGDHVDFGKPTAAFVSGATITLNPVNPLGADNGDDDIICHVCADKSTVYNVNWTTDTILRFQRYEGTEGGANGVVLGHYTGSTTDAPTLYSTMEGLEAAQTDTWDITAQAANQWGVKVPVKTRGVYNEAGDKKLYGFYRLWTISSLGNVVAISAETRYEVDAAEAC